MTDEQRHIAIQSLIQEHTAENTVSKDAAREMLIKEGIYTKTGKLRREFGGASKKANKLA
jgi:hypothetical protein